MTQPLIAPRPAAPNRSLARSLARQWRSASPDRRRELIIEAALDLLQRKGLQHVAMRRVARRLGVGAMTLYTYVNGQDELRRELTRRGFALLHDFCTTRSTLDNDGTWTGGARAYLEFARENPNLYEVMFSIPLRGDPADEAILHAGFQPLVERVKARLASTGLTGKALDDAAGQRAAIYWIGLHGMATLANSGRLNCPECNLDELLHDLLQRVAPD